MTVDIDGTLTTRHGWRVIAEARGKVAQYASTQRRFYAREISEDEHLRNLLEIAVGMTRAELDSALEITPKIGGILATVVALKERRIRVGLLTHNPSYITDWYRDRFGFEDAEGVDGPSMIAGVVGPVGSVRADKPLGLARLCDRWGIGPNEIVHVGDGWADEAVFLRVGAGVAVNSPLDEVRRRADAVLDGPDLLELLPILDRLRPRAR